MLATRAGDDHARALVAAVPEARHNPVARTVAAGAPAAVEGPPILVVTAGTSDLPVAEEAVETVRMLGQPVETLVDVGVAGVHRLLAHEPALTRAGVVIVVAGMEGALASVVGGLVRVPTIAVPTSVGYGASFEGLAALLAMLSSCAAGVVVVNIDNGFGAGFAAARINALRGSEGSGVGRVPEMGETRNVCA
jgi:NCAIR mutase (PurE)-related protein